MWVFLLLLLLLWFVGFGGSIDAAAILDFVDSGHDLIVAADNNASDLIREIATECGVDFDEVIVVEWVFVQRHFSVLCLCYGCGSVCLDAIICMLVLVLYGN